MVAEAVLLSGLTTFQTTTDIIQNNLANSVTPGFRSLVPLLQQESLKGGITPHSKLFFVKTISAYHDPKPGALTTTGYNLDFALAGPGFFTVRDAEGNTRYRRVLQAKVDPSTGSLITTEGDSILGEGGDLTVPPGTGVTEISVNPEGEITVKGQKIGAFNVVRFEDEKKLKPVGKNNLETEQEPLPILDEEGKRLTTIQQGSIESSGVNTTDVLMQVMLLQRHFQAMNDFAKSEHKRQLDLIRKLTKSITA
jgi:flagellar basal-body rod protein FlgF